MEKIIISVVFALLSAMACANELVLARRGLVGEYAIVLPVKASQAQTYAAEELRTHVKEMTGVELPVKSGANAAPEKAIVFAASDVHGEDGFRLKVNDTRLIIEAGAVRGCLYGVYELLERFGGCKWYASWHTVVPKREKFCVPDTLDLVQKPDFVMRSGWWFDMIQNKVFSTRMRINTLPWGSLDAKYGGDSFRFCRELQSCHTFNYLIPPSKYRKDHPEYFSRVKGDRTQPCLTHPDVLAIVTSNVLACVRRDPDAKAYGVSQNDWYNYCTCTNCAAVDAEEGSHAGTNVRFVNAVAEAVEREFPGKIVETLAYQYTRKPPAKTKLRSNVVPCLCTIECDFAHSIPESLFKQNKSFMDDIVGWSAMTDQLYLWDYVTNFRHYPYPLPNCYAMQGNMQFFRENKVKEMFPEGNYQGNLGDFAELKAWLLAKWMWNADLPMKDLLDDFFAGHYGKAAPYVRVYFEELHRIGRADKNRHHTIYESVKSSALPNDFFEWAAEVFSRAMESVKDEDPVYAKAVRATAFSVDYTRFMRRTSQSIPLLWFKAGEPSMNDLAETAIIAKRMLAVMEEFKPVRLSEGLQQHELELEMIKKAAERPLEKQSFPPRTTCGIVEEKDLHYCHNEKMGIFTDDPLADDGRALKLFNNHFEWSTAFPIESLAFDPGQKLKLRVRCRIVCKPGAKGETMWAGIYDWELRKEVLNISVPAEKVTGDDYVWYDVGTFTPKANCTFWIGPGRFDENGKSRIEALFVDKIELSLQQ